MVLKAACFKFIQEFKEEAGFNPMEKCATIARACNLFWRQELIPEDTITIEPLNGWRGNQVSQSKVALEWLCFEDWKLGGNRLRHVPNGGEQKVLTPVEAIYLWTVSMKQPRQHMNFMGAFITVVLNVSQTTDTESTTVIQIAPSWKSIKRHNVKHRCYSKRSIPSH